MRKSQEKLIDYAKFPGSQSNKGRGAQGKAVTEMRTFAHLESRMHNKRGSKRT